MRCGFLGLVGATLALGSTQAGAQDQLAQYRALWKEIDGLVVYNRLLERQLQNQQAELEALSVSIEQVPEIERQIPPLLDRMIQGLEQFVALDVPFHASTRADSIAELQTVIERSDVTLAEKFRRVLEVLQIENDYGRTYEAYTGDLQIDGVGQEVEFLRIGRIALLYQTPDETQTGAWNQRERAWTVLGSEHRTAVRQALRMARAQIAPDLLLLPIPPPEES